MYVSGRIEIFTIKLRPLDRIPTTWCFTHDCIICLYVFLTYPHIYMLIYTYIYIYANRWFIHSAITVYLCIKYVHWPMQLLSLYTYKLVNRYSLMYIHINANEINWIEAYSIKHAIRFAHVYTVFHISFSNALTK